MTKLEITELPDNKFVVWYNGKNALLNKDVNIEEVTKLLHKCLNFLIQKI